MGGQLDGGTKKLKIRLNKDERCTKDFNITETANYGRSIVNISCVKKLVIEKKLDTWNNIVEKANREFEGNKKQFWSFVGRRTKCKDKTISSLKSEAGISVSAPKVSFKSCCSIISF